MHSGIIKIYKWCNFIGLYRFTAEKYAKESQDSASFGSNFGNGDLF